MDKIGIYLKWDYVNRTLLAKKLKIFSLHDFQTIFKVDRKTAIKFLSRNNKKENIKSLKRGLYALSLAIPSLYKIANKLYQPSYISFETALSYYGIIPETVYSFLSATPKTSQKFEILDNTFAYHKIKQSIYSGYTTKEIEGETVLIAEPEKAVIDTLYFVSLGKKVLNERLQIDKLNKAKLNKYAKLAGRPNLLKYIKLI